MFEWIKNNLGSLLLLLVLIVCVSFLIAYFIKQKKQGKSSCSCGCKNCMLNSCCNKEKNDNLVKREE